jgi:endonuclease V-like protein UPF0215 family
MEQFLRKQDPITAVGTVMSEILFVFIWLVNGDGDEVTDAGRAMVQSVSHRPLTAESRVRFLAVPCEICEI